MRISTVLFAVVCLACSTLCAIADDHVLIESKSVPQGATGIQIRVMIANSDSISAIIIPLEFREIDSGSFITSLSVSYQERLETQLPDIRYANQYSEMNGTCMATGAPTYALRLSSELDTAVTVTQSPWGLLCTANRFNYADDLDPGADSLGSIVMTVDVSSTPGSFEIDTVCMSPNHHLLYVRPSYPLPYGIYPAFTKGVITIAECDCTYHGDLNGDGYVDALDQTLLIDWVYMGIGPPPTDATCPHIDRGDVNCDGQDDALDVDYMSIYLYENGPPPCDPCACDPYPSNCP